MENEPNPRLRLLSILKSTGLKQNDFATRLGVSAASISHIISEKGRQADITENIADRIITTFPELNLSKKWLITGVEDSFDDEDSHPNLFNIDKSESMPTPTHFKPEAMPEIPTKKTIASIETEESTSTPNAMPNNTQATTFSNHANSANAAQRVVDRIVIFYSDGTFDDYSPSRNK